MNDPDRPDEREAGAATGAAEPERSGEQALVPRPPSSPVTFRLADSLATAGRGAFVHIDGEGRVRSPLRYRVLTALNHGAALGAIAATTWIYTDLFGFAGPVAGGLLAGVYALGVRRRARAIRAAALVQADRLDEAEALCKEMLAARFIPRRLRAAALQNLAAIATRRGKFDEALNHVREAMKLRHAWWRSKNILVDILAYAEITLLVNLGRVGEARAKLEARGAAPAGDYLRVQHWTADLFVQFGEKRLQLDEDALWERGHEALKITGAAHLLALCAWGYTVRGDADMAAHLVAEATDRAEPSTAATAPTLWQWVQGQPR